MNRREKFFEVVKVSLQVETPLHIGSRHGLLHSMEFIHENGWVYVVDEEKLGRFLLEKDLLNKFSQAAYSGKLRRRGIAAFIRENLRNLPKGFAESVASYKILGGSSNMGQFRPFIRDGQNRIFLPGSAIKGALRTAVIYKSLKEGDVKKWREEVEKKLRELERVSGHERSQKIKKLSEPMQKEILQRYLLGNLQENEGKHQNRDLLRCLKVRDAYPAKGIKLDVRVIPVRFLAKGENGSFYWSKNPRGSDELIVWVEAVVSGTFETELIWDRELFERFQENNPGKSPNVRSVEDVLKCVLQMNCDLMEFEKEFFGGKPSGEGRSAALRLGQWYRSLPGGLWFRLGYGTGMLSTTVNLLWDEALRQKIRNTCGHDRGKEPAPKTRRVGQIKDGEVLPLGWVKLAFQGDEKYRCVKPGARAERPDMGTAGETARAGIEKSFSAVEVGRSGAADHRPTIQIPNKPVQKGQELEGTLHRKEGEWVARFEIDPRDALIENPQVIPPDAADGTRARFYVLRQSKKEGIKVRILGILD